MKKTLLLSGCLFYCALSQAQTADIILYHGKIFTSDEKNLFVEAVAIKGNRILATGSDSAITKLGGKNAQKINLEGKTVIPGINDAHFHLGDGFKAVSLNFNSMDPSWSDLLDSLNKIQPKLQQGGWIQATVGPSIANLPAANRFALDSITGGHPVRLLSYWGHVCIYNTLGLKLTGISTTEPNPPGGRYERMPDGKTLTGKCFEKNASDPQSNYRTISALKDENAFVDSLKSISQAFLRSGITSVQNMCTGANPSDFIRLWKKAGLPFRLRLIRWSDMSSDGRLIIPDKNLPKYTVDLPLLTVFGTKWLLDGTPLEKGAAVTEGYADDAKDVGYLDYPPRDIERFLKDAVNRNDQICFHVVGDSTVNTVLNAMKKLKIDWRQKRVRFEHADGLLPNQFEKAKSLGIIVVQNPTHFVKFSSKNYRGMLAKDGLRFKSLLKAGIPVAIGSDGPFNPFVNIMFAVLDPVHPDESMTVQQAVIAYTETAAYAEFAENEKGTLTIGKLADLAVLSQDIFTAPLLRLPNTRSVMTMVNGKIVYRPGSAIH